MAGYPYMQERHGYFTRTIGLVIKDKPEESGFDYSHLYEKDDVKNKTKDKKATNKLPYRQNA